jgi:hypothetical protein
VIPADGSLRTAAAAAGTSVSLLPLISGATAADLGFVVAGALAAIGAVASDRLLPARRRRWLSTACLVAVVGHVVFRPLSPAASVAEAVLIAGYLALACEAEVCRGAPSLVLRWAAGPCAVATVGAAAAAWVSDLADGTRTPLAVSVAGVVAVGLLLFELQRRRRLDRARR